MKPNILYPFYLEDAKQTSLRILIELAKNLNVELHIIVVSRNNIFSINEYNYVDSKQGLLSDFFYKLKQANPAIILDHEKSKTLKEGTQVHINLTNNNHLSLIHYLKENYLWVFDYHDFISMVLPGTFIQQLKKQQCKVWVISKNGSGILTQTQDLIDRYHKNKRTAHHIHRDALPLDFM
ncbi:hypothetical protein [Saccharicrinis fermentans]|uniref:Uncharacterized protein n=1 Tax=Saccharicrinis fermentans DSM 9555 = JCM 21142 TaxID=869213 RepID=W7YFJ9_9BACT|nr:hypothetical protein [Saccharicrinis fermentans]GAF03221.1 hypothetical protein JCM21142_41887 [Saccharicrinis fermentans DSM 9555 = JCM 21142]